MKILTLPGVYPPSEDTFFLANWLDSLLLRGKRLLDLGTGTGYLGILAALKGAHAVLTDISARALLNAGLNARINRVRVRLLLSDLFENVEGRYDYVVFNPPYLSPWEEVQDPAWDGGFPVIKKFLDEVEEFLEPGGCYAFVMEEDENWRRIQSILPDVRIEKNAFHLVRVIGCR